MEKKHSALSDNVETENQQYNFNKSLAYALMDSRRGHVMLRKFVLDLCEKSRLITADDETKKTLKYRWLIDVIELNIKTIELLELSDSGDYTYNSIEDMKVSIEAKSIIIVKDIVRRIIHTPMYFPINKDK
ncbi:hypothetical protein [Aliivibrio salmonicida]|uniref:Uncharacterized protein n=1 Tax=Aliivibrio salmonicida (strain LFI1238) TaxID=316275 RepID=B6ELL3_ALISL|nr:hypothetical protein [Aliivibrio salmonicida]CAQ78075.1 hypothetical protein, putative phage gene [Aliivibrio salmonicida LFI1238]